MDLGLEGRVAWVLGGSSGLGRASAISLAREGARVAISARNESRLTKAAAEISDDCLAVPVDVSDPLAIEAGHRTIASELGPIDILVANSGGPPAGGFADHDDDALDAAYRLLVASAWHLTKAVLPAMLEKGSGTLLYVTSSSTKEPIPGLLLSNMMRPAVVAMAKTLSRELGPHGIRVLCVTPGRIATPRVEALDRHRADAIGRAVEQVREESEATIPLRRYGVPTEFGDVVAFLASEQASYMTGTSVVVDGGSLHGLLS
ncbi:MAG: SDR family oxidoreductase [Actinobacteria bacterium]|nr:SDR family oxidoreductase [Actinomycetota bacterium]